MKFWQWSCFLACLLFAVPCSAQSDDTAALRKALRLPVMSNGFFFNFQNANDEVAVFSEANGYVRQIKELERQIAGDKTNPELWTQLALLRARSSDTQGSQAASRQVETLARQKLKAAGKLSPVEQAKTMALLGIALQRLNKFAEAEKTLRAAVKLAPNEVTVWQRLGRFLSAQLRSTLYTDEQQTSGAPSVASPERTERTLKLIDETAKCFDRAIALAPQRSEPYMDRFVFRSYAASYRYLAQLTVPSANTAQEQFQAGYQASLLPESRQDLQNASLHGETAFYKGTPALFEVMIATLDHGLKNPNQTDEEKGVLLFGKHFSAYPEATRSIVEKAIAALDKIAASDPKQRVFAGAVRGTLLMLSGQKDQGMTQLRAVLKERPSYKLLMDLLIAQAVGEKNYMLLESVFRDALQVSDTPRNRILLAKVYQDTDKRQEMIEQVNLALKKSPDDLLALLSAATVALQAGDAANIAKAEKYLNQAMQLPDKAPELYSHYIILRGVHLMLMGKKDEGKELIQAVIDNDKDSTQARELMAALK